jgi:magnesium-transporting ATPase (P-type)
VGVHIIAMCDVPKLRPILVLMIEHRCAQTLGKCRGRTAQGLSQRRLEEFGYNELKIPTPSAWKRLLRQFHNALIYILLIAITLTAILGMWMDMAVILVVVVLNVVIGYIQEGTAEGALDALKRTLVAKCMSFVMAKPPS